jgi:Sulfotransferase family
MLEGRQLVFVGGLHRSGTTPLTDIIAAHEEFSGLTDTGVSENEGQHLQDVYPRIRQYGGMGRFAFAPAAHLTEDSPLATRANAERLLRAWRPYWDWSKPRLVEKSPPNLIMGRFLQALFPDCSVVVVVRHPVVTALALQKWNPRLVSRSGRRHTTLYGLVAHWIKAHQLLMSDAPLIRRLHVVRYEDLVDRPDDELRRLEAFLGLTTALPRGLVRAGRSSVYAQQWERMHRGGPLTRRRRAVIADRLGPQVAKFGYDIDDLEPTGPLPELLPR